MKGYGKTYCSHTLASAVVPVPHDEKEEDVVQKLRELVFPQGFLPILTKKSVHRTLPSISRHARQCIAMLSVVNQYKAKHIKAMQTVTHYSNAKQFNSMHSNTVERHYNLHEAGCTSSSR
jgi:hypothetical protein